MSQENVENLRAVLEAWNPDAWIRGEADGDAGIALFDPEVAYEDTILPDHVGETYRGHEGVARAAERWAEPYASLTIELEQIVVVGERLVSIHQIRAKARHSGIEFEGPLAYLWTFRDGKVIHFRSYGDSEQAIEAAGVPE